MVRNRHNRHCTLRLPLCVLLLGSLACGARGVDSPPAANANSPSPRAGGDSPAAALVVAPPAPALAAAPPSAPPVNASSDSPASAPAPAEAVPEWGPGEHMRQAIAGVAQSARRVSENYSYGFEGSDVCLLGAFLLRGEQITYARNFSAGQDYVLLGGGSASTIDLDMAILDGDGNILVADTDRDATPMLRFQPKSSGAFLIKVALSAVHKDAGGAFAAVALMTNRGGYNIPVNRFEASFAPAFDLARRASAAALKHKLSTYYHMGDARREWAFLGTVLEHGEAIRFSGFHMNAPRTVAFATGDGTAHDLDLQVFDQRSGALVVQDVANDSYPVVDFVPDRSATYQIRLSNPHSSGPSLVTAMILDTEPSP